MEGQGHLSRSSPSTAAPTPATVAPCGPCRRLGTLQPEGLAPALLCPHALPSDTCLPDALISVKSLLESHLLNEAFRDHPI